MPPSSQTGGGQEGSRNALTQLNGRWSEGWEKAGLGSGAGRSAERAGWQMAPLPRINQASPGLVVGGHTARPGWCGRRRHTYLNWPCGLLSSWGCAKKAKDLMRSGEEPRAGVYSLQHGIFSSAQYLCLVLMLCLKPQRH